MHAHLKYQQNAVQSWTRIDMLLYIYDKAVHAAQSGAQLLESGDLQAVTPLQLQLQKAVVLIVDGLDLNAGEIPQNINRLCLHVLELTTGRSAEQWSQAAGILADLRDGFQGVENEARELECQGKIRPLDPIRG
ncbi:MAG: flagellar protein FliS [Planctomycetaceae bacterium]|nr:flagellar protein FliS [Planctomycetaceae bacterium]